MNQPESSQPDSWAFFDKIYCICLDSRPDRKEQASQQFAAVGLLPRVEFVRVAKCAFQGLAGPDNQTVVIDRMRRFFGGLPFIQKANEFYQNHKVVLLPAALVVLFTIVALLTFELW